MPVRGGTVVTSWPSAVSSVRVDSGTSASTFDVAARERALREPAGLERLLDVEPVVDDVGDELRVRLRLVEAAHDPEPDPHVALLHEPRDDRVQRPLARREPFGCPSSSVNSPPRLCSMKPVPGGDEAAAEP